MPNHVHGIIILVGATPCGCPDQTGQAQGPAPTARTTTAAMSLPDVVHRFKTMTTRKYTDGVKQNRWTPFPGKLWQRNYYEHVVRSDRELSSIREYLLNNPRKWHLDRENPNHPIRRK
jgi:REP element-mobilizing transposase RayT